EQAKGVSADARSDLFSFGCVLYEMLTGTQTFQGETVSEIIASVLIREPDLASLPAGLDPRLVALLKRSLEKNLRKRWHCAGDLLAELERISAEPYVKPESPAAAPVRRPLIGKRAIPFIVAAAVATVVGGFGLGYWYYASNIVPPIGRFLISPP